MHRTVRHGSHLYFGFLLRRCVMNVIGFLIGAMLLSALGLVIAGHANLALLLMGGLLLFWLGGRLRTGRR